MKNSLTLIKELKLVETPKSFEILLKSYLEDGYSVKNLLKNITDAGKRKIMLEMIFKQPIIEPTKMIEDCYDYMLSDEKVYVFRIVLEKSPLQAYYFFRKINNPKAKLTSEEIAKIINQTTTSVVIEDYNSYFAEELLKKDDYYELLSIRQNLLKNIIDEIYEKSILKTDDHDFIRVIEYLNNEEKQNYARMFLNLDSKNYKIAMYVLDNKIYFKEDFDKLLKIVGNNAPADVIYKVLMNETLSEENKKTLEKGLLRTGDIEYISYYYFYKNKDVFIQLFGSTLLFLSFVMINKSIFKNKLLLEEVIIKIKAENASYSDDVAKAVAKYKSKIVK